MPTSQKQQVIRSLLQNQNYRCWGCRIYFHGPYRIGSYQQDRYCVDHNHKTGNIRGLLCWKCNLALGYAKDSPERMRLANDKGLVSLAPTPAIRERLAVYLERGDSLREYGTFNAVYDPRYLKNAFLCSACGHYKKNPSLAKKLGETKLCSACVKAGAKLPEKKPWRNVVRCPRCQKKFSASVLKAGEPCMYCSRS